MEMTCLPEADNQYRMNRLGMVAGGKRRSIYAPVVVSDKIHPLLHYIITLVYPYIEFISL